MDGRLDRFNLCAILDRMICAIRCQDLKYFFSLDNLYSSVARGVYSPRTVREDFIYERIRISCEELAQMCRDTDLHRWELRVRALEKSLPMPKFT